MEVSNENKFGGEGDKIDLQTHAPIAFPGGACRKVWVHTAISYHLVMMLACLTDHESLQQKCEQKRLPLVDTPVPCEVLQYSGIDDAVLWDVLC